jgi:hypothetical protein
MGCNPVQHLLITGSLDFTQAATKHGDLPIRAQVPNILNVLQTLSVFEISSSHGGEYELQICFLGCTAV